MMKRVVIEVLFFLAVAIPITAFGVEQRGLDHHRVFEDPFGRSHDLVSTA